MRVVLSFGETSVAHIHRSSRAAGQASAGGIQPGNPAAQHAGAIDASVVSVRAGPRGDLICLFSELSAGRFPDHPPPNLIPASKQSEELLCCEPQFNIIYQIGNGTDFVPGWTSREVECVGCHALPLLR